MTQEIIYTSAPKGLKAGSRGFCTVVSSEGMARNLAERLESFSGYRHVFGIHDADRDLNPINWAHTAMRIGGRNWHVLSRIADAGQDYSGRSNKLAHHIALDDAEKSPAGPARILQTTGIISDEWDGHVGINPQRRLPAIAQPDSADCSAWKELAGDAGWAGAVAEHVSSQRTPASIIFPAECGDTLGLVVGVLDLLPAEQRWNVTFSTYFTQLVPGTECRLRFVLDGTSEAVALRNHPHAFVVDLCADLAAASGGKLVDAARSGRLPDSARPAAAGQPRRSVSAKPIVTSRRESPAVEDPEDEIVFASASEAVPEPASFDSDSDQDDSGTYSLQPGAPEHEGRPKAPPRRGSAGRAAGAPSAGQSESRRRNILIISSAVGGMLLLVAVAVIAFQLGRQPETDPDSGEQNGLANAGSAGVSEQPQFGYQPKSPDRVKSGTSSNAPDKDLTAAADVVGSGNPEDEPSAGAVASTDAAKPTSNDQSEGDADLKSPTEKKNGGSGTKGDSGDETTKKKDTPKKSESEQRNSEERGPFANLKSSSEETRELFLPAKGTEGKWELLTTDEISLSLLGGSLLFGGSEGENEKKGFECRKENDAETWKVTVWDEGNIGAPESKTVGAFKVLRRDGDTQFLSFTWAEDRSQSSALFRWTLLRIEAGNASAVCRLSKPEKWTAVKLSGTKPENFATEVTMSLPENLGPLSDAGRDRLKLIVEPGKQFPASESEPTEKGSRLIVPLGKVPLNRSSDPYIQIEVTPKLNGDDVELSLEGYLVAHAYSKESIRDIGKSIEFNSQHELTPPSNDPIALDKVQRRLSKNEWDAVNKELKTLMEKATQFHNDAMANSMNAPNDKSLKNDLTVTTKLNQDIASRIESHGKNKFTELTDKVNKIKQQIAGATLSLKLALDVKGRVGTYHVVLVEVDGATE